MDELISSYEELIKFLLYLRFPEPKLKVEICVGVIGDADISDKLSPDFAAQLLQLLKLD